MTLGPISRIALSSSSSTGSRLTPRERHDMRYDSHSSCAARADVGARIRAAFTLTEMVVVLAIISLLLAMCLPALSLARAKSRSAVCISNLRQIGVAMESYQQVWDGAIPKVLGRGDETLALSGGGWSLIPSACAAEGAGEDAGVRSSLLQYCKEPQIFICPDRPDAAQASYGLNGRVIGVVSKFRQIPNPTETPIAFDSKLEVGQNYSDLDIRHIACANMLYSDYHVSSFHHDPLYSFSSAVPLPGVVNYVAEGAGDPHTFGIRIAGCQWNTVTLRLLEDGEAICVRTIDRQPGNPNDQIVSLGPVALDPQNKQYTLALNINFGSHGNGQGQGGGSPMWISVDGGSWNRLPMLNPNNPSATVNINPMLD